MGHTLLSSCMPTKVVDINGVITRHLYGAFNTPVFEGVQTGASQQTLLSLCNYWDNLCPSTGKLISTTEKAAGGSRFTVVNALGNTVREAQQHFDGSWTYVDTEYDVLGERGRRKGTEGLERGRRD